MDITKTSFTASTIATNGIKQGFEQLAQTSQSINRSLPNYQIEQPDNTNAINYEALNMVASESLETNIIDLKTSENQIKSLAKVIEVENKLFDESMGKIFDGWA
ncbi:hypothetical protein THMIRHAM_11860 [Thiomicrorhabdus immobilis]|uniref:Flagellar basal-body/hook protein C-terminal domain-containing protein n=1 Tax=Thiomicrorhabdus immobilis TaxID=2791037 RepID=A0ABN6CWF3_9GAMM|nr:hypothetical protein [Thiomicrorhabdus immobilis]BCN93401.1 hypothetical protein THMIRHAM_11860 [Thiomicrorhabdus immobilis]